MNDKLRITIKAICLVLSGLAASAGNQQVAILFDNKTLAVIKLIGSTSLILFAYLDKGIANLGLSSTTLLPGFGTVMNVNSEQAK